MLNTLKGKTVLVAGASRGIGLAIARAMAEAGAHTIVAARSLANLQAIATELNGAALELDVTSADSIHACAEQAGAVDILVNVAGINIRKPFERYTEQEYADIMQTNLHGIAHLTQLVGARMIERGAVGRDDDEPAIVVIERNRAVVPAGLEEGVEIGHGMKIAPSAWKEQRD